MSKGEKLKRFLQELAELSKKYGIELYGCGCCDAVLDMESKKAIGTYLEYDNGRYMSNPIYDDWKMEEV